MRHDGRRGDIRNSSDVVACFAAAFPGICSSRWQWALPDVCCEDGF